MLLGNKSYMGLQFERKLRFLVINLVCIFPGTFDTTLQAVTVVSEVTTEQTQKTGEELSGFVLFSISANSCLGLCEFCESVVPDKETRSSPPREPGFPSNRLFSTR